MTTERERQRRLGRKGEKSYRTTNYSKPIRPINPMRDRLIILLGIISIILGTITTIKLLNWAYLSKIVKFKPTVTFSPLSKTTEATQPITNPNPNLTPTLTPNLTQSQSTPIKQVGDTQLLKQYDYTKIDQLAISIHYKGTSVKDLANKLKAHANTDLEKARLIYTWISHNIAYDFSAFQSGIYGDLSPEGVLKTRKAVCSGYSSLYQALANAIGLEATVIRGYSKGYSYNIGELTKINHAWNAVRIDNSWYLVDSTWGAGYITNNKFVRKFKPFYFATPPTQFIYDHLPSERSWQLLAKPYTKNQFEELPKVSSVFFKYRMNLMSHQTHTIQANSQAKVLLNIPDDIVIMARLYANKVPLERHYTLIKKEPNQTGVDVTFPNAGTYELMIFAKPKGQQGNYHHAISYRVIVSQPTRNSRRN